MRPGSIKYRNKVSISSTHLRAAFMAVSPKSVRVQSSPQYLFMLLGSVCIKAAYRMLMKLTQVAQHRTIYNRKNNTEQFSASKKA